jgi:hypothetical protein
MRSKHVKTREEDEYACSCGLRWGVKEEDPHTIREPRYRKLASGQWKDTETGYVSFTRGGD